MATIGRYTHREETGGEPDRRPDGRSVCVAVAVSIGIAVAIDVDIGVNVGIGISLDQPIGIDFEWARQQRQRALRVSEAVPDPANRFRQRRAGESTMEDEKPDEPADTAETTSDSPLPPA
jgi:hypothetical protein